MAGTTELQSLPPYLQVLLTKNKNGLNLNHSPFIISTKIHGLRGTGVVDSGAGVSVVGVAMVRQIQKTRLSTAQVLEYNIDLRGANDTNLKVIGIVSLNF